MLLRKKTQAKEEASRIRPTSRFWHRLGIVVTHCGRRSAPGRNRTCGPGIRNPVLCPTELQAHRVRQSDAVILLHGVSGCQALPESARRTVARGHSSQGRLSTGGILSQGAGVFSRIARLQGCHPAGRISRARASWGLRRMVRWKCLSSREASSGPPSVRGVTVR